MCICVLSDKNYVLISRPICMLLKSYYIYHTYRYISRLCSAFKNQSINKAAKNPYLYYLELKFLVQTSFLKIYYMLILILKKWQCILHGILSLPVLFDSILCTAFQVRDYFQQSFYFHNLSLVLKFNMLSVCCICV